MLVELRLENYAVIDNAAVEFASGLNLLTGETGAGKSILIDALALLLGEKASSDVIRSGAERAVVSAVFEMRRHSRGRDRESTRAQRPGRIGRWLADRAARDCRRRQRPRVREQSGSNGRRAAAACAASGDHPCAKRIDSVLRWLRSTGVAGWICRKPDRAGSGSL